MEHGGESGSAVSGRGRSQLSIKRSGVLACKAKVVRSLARPSVEIFFRFHQLPPLTTLTDPRRRLPTPSTLPKRTLEE